MKRADWAEKYGVDEIDMQLLDAVQKSLCSRCLPDAVCNHQRGKITEVEKPPLSYADIKYTMNKIFRLTNSRT